MNEKTKYLYLLNTNMVLLNSIQLVYELNLPMCHGQHSAIEVFVNQLRQLGDDFSKKLEDCPE